jgi:hypothetical protein
MNDSASPTTLLVPSDFLIQRHNGLLHAQRRAAARRQSRCCARSPRAASTCAASPETHCSAESRARRRAAPGPSAAAARPSRAARRSPARTRRSRPAARPAAARSPATRTRRCRLFTYSVVSFITRAALPSAAASGCVGWRARAQLLQQHHVARQPLHGHDQQIAQRNAVHALGGALPVAEARVAAARLERVEAAIEFVGKLVVRLEERLDREENVADQRRLVVERRACARRGAPAASCERP